MNLKSFLKVKEVNIQTESYSIRQEIKESKLQSQLEQEIKIYLDEFFTGFKFEKIKPEWLKNPRTGKNLELDFYCAELKIAIECQGLFHNKFIKFYHKNNQGFADQLQRDDDKAFLTQKQGIQLFYIYEGQNIYETIKKIRESLVL
jgi:hypothetical protein